MTDITFRRNPTAALYRVLVERFPFGDHEPKTANEADLRAAGYVPALEADTVSRAEHEALDSAYKLVKSERDIAEAKLTALQAEHERVKLDFANTCDVGRRLEARVAELIAESQGHDAALATERARAEEAEEAVAVLGPQVERLTRELEDVRKLDAWALASMHKVVRIGRASGGRAAVLLVEVNKVEPFTGDKPEHARRAAVEYLEKESKDG